MTSQELMVLIGRSSVKKDKSNLSLINLEGDTVSIDPFVLAKSIDKLYQKRQIADATTTSLLEDSLKSSMQREDRAIFEGLLKYSEENPDALVSRMIKAPENDKVVADFLESKTQETHK